MREEAAAGNGRTPIEAFGSATQDVEPFARSRANGRLTPAPFCEGRLPSIVIGTRSPGT